MKAISRLLIVALLFVGTTGFGLTTTDLSQNSDPDIVICDYADVISVEVVDFKFDLTAYQSYVAVSKNVLLSQEELKAFNDESIKSEYDVGWRNQKVFLNRKLKRNPRDGLTHYSE